MEGYGEDLRYGLELYPFALTVAAGFFLSATGPAVLRSVTAGMRGVTGYSAALLASMLVLQALGAVVAFAGFFGALKRVMEDS